ncbi:alpha/beta hydrolase [Spirosoma soli]|uniref:Alpha/beta hydrolase n=1 Tax=Spirosoma soli TaxID=1770529 RepID=A0ABW5M740_9BACT
METTNVVTAGRVERQNVTFQRDELTIAGHLFTPPGFDEELQYPALIVQGAVTMVKENAPDNYAPLLAREGFVVLDFDYVSYGESEGQPRKNENVEGKLKDLQAALTYLQTLSYVGKIGMVGICTSGGNAAYLAATDDRLTALAAVVPWMYEPALEEPFWGSETIEKNNQKAQDARQRFAQNGEWLTTQIFTNDPMVEGFNLTPGEYYFDKHRGGSVNQWRNQIFWGAWEEWAQVFDPISQAPKIRIPTLVFSTDDALIPDQAKKFYNLLNTEKELVWSEGYHFNFYDVAPEIYKAIDAVVPFMQKHLADS